MNHLKITNTDDLLTNAATPRLIEAKITILMLGNNGTLTGSGGGQGQGAGAANTIAQ